VLGIAVLVASARCRSSSEKAVDLVGPSGTFRVRPFGGFAAPSIVARHATRVMAEVKAHDGFAIAPFEIYQSDFLDHGFEDRFPSAIWLSDRVLQFISWTRAVDRSAASITVQNDSDAMIPALQIHANDMILVLRLEPGTRHTFNVMWGPDWNPACVGATAWKTDGGVSSTKSSCFEWKRGTPMIFQVSVHPAGINITARQS
jgi:hypothetical protein